MTINVIELMQLTKHYDTVKALDGLTFSVREGEVFGLLGPNGAGKTTAIRVMNGLLPYSEGQVSVLGWDPRTHGDQIRLHAGVLTETPAQYERLNARQNLEFSGRMWDLSGQVLDQRVDEMLHLFDLAGRAGDLVGSYSKGMKQRMALARALLPRPDLLFLDEPTSGLDPESAQQVNHLIEQIGRERGKTVFLCTHLLHEAQRLCDRVAILNHGKLLALGTPKDLARDVFPGVRLVVEMEQEADQKTLADLSGLPFVKGVEKDKVGWLHLSLRSVGDTPDLVTALVGWGFRIRRVEPQEVTLEDVYFAIQEKENGRSK